MKIGIYSGTFNPAHEGHILFAHVAYEQFGLDKILIIPEETPRHKTGVIDVLDRLAMLKLATEDAPHVEVFKADAPTHTITGVIPQIVKEFPEDDYFMLMGSDAFRHVGAWGVDNPEDGTVADIAHSIPFIVGVQKVAEVPELEAVAKEHALTAQFLEIPIPGLSSTKIRGQVEAGETPRGVNDSVAEYIARRELYR